MVAVVGSCIHPGPSSRENQNRPQKLVLPACVVLEKCPARVHVCVGTYARVARAAFAVYRQHARYLSSREEQFLREKILFLVNAPTYTHNRGHRSPFVS